MVGFLSLAARAFGARITYARTGSSIGPVAMTSQEPVGPPFAFPLQLDGESGGRMRQLHEQLRAAILDRRLRAGAELPSTRRVATAYAIARNTVIAAYDLLIAEGYVIPRTRSEERRVGK